MRTLPTLLAGLVAAIVLAGQANAQVTVRPTAHGYGVSHGTPGLYPVYPPYGPYYYRYHASTAAEGYMRGMAAVIQAQGYYNVLTAQATVLHEEARRSNIENRRQATQTAFEMRRTNREARAEERGPRATPEQIARLAKSGAPARLSAEQFDAATGRIAWPAALLGEEFAAYRAEIEGLFVQRASSGGLETAEQERVDQAAGAMLAILKDRITELPAMDYTKARRFIESLDYEAQLPTA